MWQATLLLERGDCRAIAGCLVSVQLAGLFLVIQAAQGLAQETLRYLGASSRRKVEVDHVAVLIERPVQVGPFTPDLDIGFVKTTARIEVAPPERAQPLLHLRNVPLNPAVDRRVVDGDAPFGEHFLQIAVADRVAAVPSNRPKDNLALKMAPLESSHRSVRFRKGNASPPF